MIKSSTIGNNEKLTFPKFIILALLYINIGRPQDIFTFLKALSIGKIFGIITLFCILQNYKKERPSGSIKIDENKWIISFWIILLISTLFSIYPRLSVEFLRNYLVVMVLYLGLIVFLKSNEDFGRIAIVMLISALTLALPIYFIGITARRVSVGTYYDPNDLAMFIACCLPFILYLFHHRRKSIKIVSLGTILLSLVAIISTQSRMGFLSLLITAFLYIILGVTQKSNVIKKILILGSISFVFVSMTDSFYWDRILSTFEKGQTGSGRTIILKRGFKIVAKYPVLGVGPGAFMSAYGRMLKAGKFDKAGGVYDRAWKAGHNSYLKVMVEMGIPGIFIFLGLISVTLKKMFAIRKKFLKHEKQYHVALKANVILMSMTIFVFCAFFLSHATSPLFVTLVASSILVQRLSYEQESEI